MEHSDAIERMKELSRILTKASEAYYAKDEEIISNFEYDRLYEELEQLEKETNTVLSMSPTQRVGYEAVDELQKEHHDSPMLSLNKTKSREELRDWLQGKEGLLSWKLDGLTIVLTYENGKLSKAVTRGNGEVGEVVTANAKTFINIPHTIDFKDKMILRGEAVISYSDFAAINDGIENPEDKYKNPRNLCSGSVRQLNSEITAKRRVRFFAFSLVSAGNMEFTSGEDKYIFMKNLGFEVVEYVRVNPETILSAIENYEERIKEYDIPSDGLVLLYEDIVFGQSLGRTAKFPRDAIAFKWADEVRETKLIEIEWSPSRTGLINPVAIFEPVELEGTTVSRASVHNVSVMRSLQLGIGDIITVYKANMIIPQIADNLTKSNTIEIPKVCPVCNETTEIRDENGVQSLFCRNGKCPVKRIKAFTHFVSRDALNVDGLSESTLEKFIAGGFIHEFADVFHLKEYREEIVGMEGFGEKSYDNLIEALEASREVTAAKLIYALGIENVGLATAKLISKEFGYNIDAIIHASRERISNIAGLGEVIANSFCTYFESENNLLRFRRLQEELHIQNEEDTIQSLEGMTFVITGSLSHFKDRSELTDIITSMGGKVSGSVNAKTECLLNNDITSTSSKNKKAKELGVTIMTEEDFIAKYQVEPTI